jgi:hypothetical protein
MHILMTTGFLVSHTGSEEVIRDLSHGLLRRNHSVTVYSPRIRGDTVARIWSDQIAITDDITQVEKPDVIHAQHATAFLRAWQQFPTVPMVHFIHDVSHVTDEPIRLPSVVKHVAVDRVRAQRAIAAGVRRDRIAVVRNAVDLSRFPKKSAHARVSRVLAVSKYHHSFKGQVQQALKGYGLEIDVVESGEFRADFGELLQSHDLLIGSGRCALEAAAVGLSVIVCDERGFAGPLSRNSWPGFRAGNFGQPCFVRPTNATAIRQGLDELDPMEAALLTPRVREEVRLEGQIGLIEDIYREAMAARSMHRPPQVVMEDLVEDMLRLHASAAGLVPEDIGSVQKARDAADLRDAKAELAAVQAELDLTRARLTKVQQAGQRSSPARQIARRLFSRLPRSQPACRTPSP